jgi:hypothetical protein
MHAMAWLGGDQALLFGSADIPFDDRSWVYDLSEDSWTSMNPATSPSNRWEHGMVRIGNDQVLLFGGDGLNDTWIYDLSENSWTEKTPPTNPPGGPSSMAWIGGDQALLFGGRADSVHNETWVYDLSENSWTQMMPSASPSRRNYHGMAWLGGDRVLLYGGTSVFREHYDDTWVYDLSENSWTEIAVPSAPRRRRDHDMAWLGGGKVLMFGGWITGDTTYADTTYGDTWIFTGADASPPEPIDDLSIVLDNGSKSFSGNMFLSWTKPYDDVGVSRYVVYRSTDPASMGDSLAGTTDSSYTDPGTAGNIAENYFYVVKAVDAAGNKSAESNRVGEFDAVLTNGTKGTAERESCGLN